MSQELQQQYLNEMVEGATLLLDGAELSEFLYEAIDEKYSVLCPDEASILDRARALYFSVYGVIQDISFIGEHDMNILKDMKTWVHRYYKALKH